MAEVKALWLKPAPLASMSEQTELRLTLEDGVEGGAPTVKDRQVTVLTVEAWQAACEEVGETIDPSERRANILIDGVDLAETASRRLRIGEVLLHICFETLPCHRMDDVTPGLLKALGPHWRGGVCCEVVEAGTVRPGDPVELV